MSTITLLTSAGAVRVVGENLVIDIREFANAPEGPQLNDEPSPEVGPQAEASHVGTDTGMPADREGRRDGEAASVDLPTNSETPADTAPRRQATAARASTASQGARAPHSAPSKAETGRAGGPVCAPVTHSDPAERPSDAIFGERFSHPTSNVTTISSQPAGSVGVPHSKPHKSGEVKVQPANLSDPRDPGPIPSWMDKRAKKDAA